MYQFINLYESTGRIRRKTGNHKESVQQLCVCRTCKRLFILNENWYIHYTTRKERNYMKLSTRSRYGLRLLVELAMAPPETTMFLGDIAKQQDISEKYLSKLVIPLRGARLIISRRGANGGYMLARDPREITLKEIVEALEGELFPLDCVKDPEVCTRTPQCASHDVWVDLNRAISEYLEGISLESIVQDYKKKLGVSDPFVYTI